MVAGYGKGRWKQPEPVGFFGPGSGMVYRGMAFRGADARLEGAGIFADIVQKAAHGPKRFCVKIGGKLCGQPCSAAQVLVNALYRAVFARVGNVFWRCHISIFPS